VTSAGWRTPAEPASARHSHQRVLVRSPTATEDLNLRYTSGDCPWPRPAGTWRNCLDRTWSSRRKRDFSSTAGWLGHGGDTPRHVPGRWLTSADGRRKRTAARATARGDQDPARLGP